MIVFWILLAAPRAVPGHGIGAAQPKKLAASSRPQYTSSSSSSVSLSSSPKAFPSSSSAMALILGLWARAEDHGQEDFSWRLYGRSPCGKVGKPMIEKLEAKKCRATTAGGFDLSFEKETHGKRVFVWLPRDEKGPFEKRVKVDTEVCK